MIVLYVVSGLALVLALLGLTLNRTSAYTQRLRRRVVIHTRDDRSVKGVLVAHYHDAVSLENVSYLHEARETEVEGEALVLKSNISFTQVLSDA